MQFPAVVTKEEKLYVAHCPEVDVTSQGHTIEEALDNLKEALELYLEDEKAEIPKRLMTPLLTSVEVNGSGSPSSIRSEND